MASAEKPSHLRLCHIAIEKWYNAIELSGAAAVCRVRSSDRACENSIFQKWASMESRGSDVKNAKIRVFTQAGKGLGGAKPHGKATGVAGPVEAMDDGPRLVRIRGVLRKESRRLSARPAV